MITESEADLEGTPRLPPLFVVLAILGLGVVFGMAGDSVADPDTAEALFNLCLLCCAMAPFVWIVSHWQPVLGRWAAVLAVVAMILGTAFWLDLPQALAFLFVPTALAVVLVGAPGALAVALGESLLLVLSAPRLWPGQDQTAITLGLVAVWLSLGLAWAVYWHVGQLVKISWQRFYYAQRALEETRERQGALNQALDDLATRNRQLSLLN